MASAEVLPASLAARTSPVARVHGTTVRAIASLPICNPRLQCGQRALAHLTGWSLAAITGAVGHASAMRLLEVRQFFRRYAAQQPAYVGAETLHTLPIDTWWTYGADTFRALLATFGDNDPAVPGHAVAMIGRLVWDGDRSGTLVDPAALAHYDLAIIMPDISAADRGAP